MPAFTGAVSAGAHAIETDLHLSRDGVVVISHDKDLKRCYGVEGLVKHHDWEFLKGLKTVRTPAQPMPRLSDLLEYLAGDEAAEATWVLLDIKVDDDAREMMTRLAATLAAVPDANWKERILLGCWTPKHVQLAAELLPGYAVSWIGITIPLAKEYLAIPNVALNVRQESLRYWRGGKALLDQCKEEGRPVFAWTVNKRSWMQWGIKRRLDAVITDDVGLFLEVCREEKGKDGEGEGVVGFARGLAWSVLLVILLQVFGRQYYKRVGRPGEARETLRGL